MSLASAMKQAKALSDYKMQQQERLQQKEKLKKENKEWNENVLVDGGVSWFEVVEKVVVEKNGVKKLTNKKKKVKVSVILQHQESTTIPNKGKFSFRNGFGNRVFLNVKSYVDADKLVRQIYEIKDGVKTPYLITASAV